MLINLVCAVRAVKLILLLNVANPLMFKEEIPIPANIPFLENFETKDGSEVFQVFARHEYEREYYLGWQVELFSEIHGPYHTYYGRQVRGAQAMAARNGANACRRVIDRLEKEYNQTFVVELSKRAFRDYNGVVADSFGNPEEQQTIKKD